MPFDRDSRRSGTRPPLGKLSAALASWLWGIPTSLFDFQAYTRCMSPQIHGNMLDIHSLCHMTSTECERQRPSHTLWKLTASVSVYATTVNHASEKAHSSMNANANRKKEESTHQPAKGEISSDTRRLAVFLIELKLQNKGQPGINHSHSAFQPPQVYLDARFLCFRPLVGSDIPLISYLFHAVMLPVSLAVIYYLVKSKDARLELVTTYCLGCDLMSSAVARNIWLHSDGERSE